MSSEEYEPEYLSSESLRRILAALPAGANGSGPMCDLAALVYLNGKETVEKGTGRGVKADMRAMHREVLRANQALDPTRMEIIGFVGVFGGAGAIPRFNALKEELVWLEALLSKVLNWPMRRMAKSHPYYLPFSIALLTSVFERGTRTLATHSLHRDGQYVGEPLSPFGRFVVAFFAEVDPDLKPRTIGSAIRAAFATFERGGERIGEAEGIRSSPRRKKH